MIKITKAGWIYILLTVALGIAGVNTANNLVYMIVSAMLSFMIISGTLGKLNLSNLEIQIFQPTEVYAGREFPLKVSLKNKKRFFPSFLISVNIQKNKKTVAYIDPKEEKQLHVMLLFNTRGVKKLPPIKICSVFPFNFFIRCKTIFVEDSILVFPKPKKCYLFSQEENSRGQNTNQKKGFFDEFISVRDYIPTDPIKYIHWKLSAKTDSLKTKEFLDTTSVPVIINLDEIEGDTEAKISCATYTILEFFKRARPVGLKYKENFFPPQHSKSHKIKLLRFLTQI